MSEEEQKELHKVVMLYANDEFTVLDELMIHFRTQFNDKLKQGYTVIDKVLRNGKNEIIDDIAGFSDFYGFPEYSGFVQYYITFSEIVAKDWEKQLNWNKYMKAFVADTFLILPTDNLEYYRKKFNWEIEKGYFVFNGLILNSDFDVVEPSVVSSSYFDEYGGFVGYYNEVAAYISDNEEYLKSSIELKSEENE